MQFTFSSSSAFMRSQKYAGFLLTSSFSAFSFFIASAEYCSLNCASRASVIVRTSNRPPIHSYTTL